MIFSGERLLALGLLSAMAGAPGSRVRLGQAAAAGNAQIQNGKPDLWVSSELGLRQGKSVDAALKEPLEDTFEVTVGSAQKTLHTCLDYLAVEKSGYDAGPAVFANALHYQGARCDALDLLRSARAASHPTFADFSFRQLSTRDLPPGLALIIAREEEKKADGLSKQGASILALEQTAALHPKRADEAELVVHNWTATLTVFARADFFGDGNEELLIRRNAAATGGTYRSTNIFLLARSGKGNSLRIVMTRP